MVPKGWKTVTLKDLLDGQIKNGYSPNATDSETGYWVLSLGALADEGINSSGIKPVLPEEKVLQNLLKKDDFLVSRSNTPDKVGRSIRFKNEIENCSYPDLMMRFRIDDTKADKEFIEQQLKSSTVRAYFKNCAAGSSSTMVKINKGILEKTPIVVPPIKEQKKIAQVLFAWDKAIAATEKLIINSQQQKKILTHQLLSRKKRLLNKSGVIFSDDWKQVKYADVVTTKTGNSKLIKGKLSDSPIVNGFPGYSASGQDIWLYDYEHDCNAIIVSAVGSRCGKCFQARGKWSAIANTHIIFPNESLIDVYFLYCHINDEQFWIRGGSGQPFVKVKDSLQAKVSLPSLEEQQKIATVLSAADAEISMLEKKLACLKDEKKALMQQLLTGKRRVKVEAEEAVSA